MSITIKLVKVLTYSDVGFFIPKSHGPNESLVFDRPSGKIPPDEHGLIDHTLPP